MFTVVLHRFTAFLINLDFANQNGGKRCTDLKDMLVIFYLRMTHFNSANYLLF